MITDEEIDWFLDNLPLCIDGQHVEGQSLYDIALKLISHYRGTKDMQWISVDERLPTEGQIYVAYHHNWMPSVERWNTEYQIGQIVGLTDDLMTNWMPLPPLNKDKDHD